MACLAALALLLSACVTRQQVVRESADAMPFAQALQLQGEREAMLAASPDWSLNGRVALRSGGQGGSGRLEWKAGPEPGAHSVSLSAPVTRQGWTLAFDDARPGASLQGMDGGTRHGHAAEALLYEATGWDVPVRLLAAWVRGGRDALEPLSAQRYDARGRLVHLEQAGWRIDYRWPQADADEPVMPARIDAERGDARVRLVIDEWRMSPPAPQSPPVS